ncbi:hypothetical protein HPP92_009725 [Vanilla planifolia]|uniref:RRP15-like protein n=1 Tax=Vanilla planifolia TaxID=51239 RepID=A0A835RH57_VANPL|nr:hypothetical protein HPP92_009941 [Vanilla planifolia]KAG0487630.1 hypothetical protein HPP92_009725 [Vanilla planifolia]
MAAKLQSIEAAAVKGPKKRKPNHGKTGNASKKTKQYPRFEPMTKKPSKKMKKLFRKRSRDYNSDDEEEMKREVDLDPGSPGGDLGNNDDDKSMDVLKDYNESDEDAMDKASEGYQGIIKFAEGSRAFRMAFLSIMNKNLPNDPLGPVLSAHKKLVAEKLADEDAEHKVKSEAKKEKHLVAEKGHVKPAGFLDSKEKFLIGVATKGVVKLFNAVKKVQNPQKSLNPSKSKDAKALSKQRKEAFISELKKQTSTSAFRSSKVFQTKEESEPGWAPLRDSYMLTSSKLKDWDKIEDPPTVCGNDNVTFDESSSEED